MPIILLILFFNFISAVSYNNFILIKKIIKCKIENIIEKNIMDETFDSEEIISDTDNMKKLNIKHLVLSGGGQGGFSIYGAVSELINNKVIFLDDIETLYSTSAGAFISVIICLPLKNNDLIEYFMNRPWENIFPLHPTMVFDVYNNKGLYDGKFINEMFKPLLGACDLSIDITLKEFHEYTNKEHHFFTVDVNNFELLDISYKNYPNLSLLTALHMTSAIPYLIQPVIYDNKCLIDGGVIMNYPVTPCIEQNKCSEDEVLGIKTISLYNNNPIIDTNSTLLDLTYSFLFHIKNNLQSSDSDKYKINVINLPFEGIKISSLREIICCKESRIQLLTKGKEIAKDYIIDLKQ